jgi:diguanylate cyclase (GGDEF)-like protein/PAS domain S-box-containing protein
MMFLVIFVLRFMITGPERMVLLLCVVPIALVAMALGTIGGLASATLSYTIFLIWMLISREHVVLLDHLTRLFAFFTIGGLVGYYTTQARLSEEEGARWFEISLDIAGLAGFDGYWKRTNPSFAKTLGYENEELLKTSFLDFVHPDDLDRTSQAAASLSQGVDVVGFQNRYRAKDGSYRWIDWACKSNMATGRIYASGKDVTERKEAEEKLLVAEERFRTAFDGAPIGMALVGLDGRWLQANDALCQLTGYSLDEILEAGFHDITHPDDRAADAEQGQKLRSGEIESYRLEKRFIHAEGHPVWVSFNSSLVSLPDGPPLFLISQVEDISKRKHLEEELRHLAQHDALTGLFNRRRFDEELSRQLAHVARYKGSGALLLIDLDGFKQVNDTEGHAAGDSALRAVGDLLKAHLRSTDVAARIGGDEFAVILAETGSSGAERVAGKLVDAMQNELNAAAGSASPLRLSIGITLFESMISLSPDQAMHQADRAMYASKRLGGNGFSFYADTASQLAESGSRQT